MAAVHTAESTAGWADVLERVCFPLVVEHVTPGPFRASVTWVDLGQARLYRVRSGPLAYRRDRSQIRAATGHYFVLPIPLRSSIVRDQQGVEVVIGPGEGSLGDSATPYRYVQLGGGEVLSLRLDAAALLARVPSRATRGGVALDLRSGSGRLITDLLGGVWALDAGTSDEVRRRLGPVVLDLVALALEDARPALSEDAVREAHRARVLRHVEEHLHDASLDPVGIARVLGVSVRYLHGLFADHDTTLMRHVRRRRIERAYEDLLHAPAGRTVTAVAHRWGFRDTAHFSRSFRAHYGCAPRDVHGRARAGNDDGVAAR